MFHFLKNTTMVPDFAARQANDDSIVITKWKDYPLVYSQSIANDHVHCDQKYESFEQWYEANFETDADFVGWIYNTREIGVKIYADAEAYAKIVIKWMRFICKTLTVDQVYTIYKLSTLWYYLYQVHLHMNNHDATLVDHSILVDSYKTIDKVQFEQYYSEITFDDNDIAELKALAKNYISNEFKYAFFLNGDKSFKSMVTEHVNKALVRCLKMELDQYKYVSLYDILYSHLNDNVDSIDDDLFNIIKQTSKTLPNDQTIDESIDQLYQYGTMNDHELLTHNNVLVDDYYKILAKGTSLTKKLNFFANLASEGINKSEFVDCFSSSYMLYNLLIMRWIITMYKDDTTQLANFVY